jgi:DNA-binding CsgD family transcriptional regulator
VNDARLTELRRLLRAGRLEQDLVDELRAVVSRLVRLRLLPPSYSPYGLWDDEAVDEIFQSWYERRLLGRGLQLLLDRAASAGAFRRLAEQSLRQHLLNERARSQAQNLYWRLVRLLEDDDEFRLVRSAERVQDRWWGLGADSAEWSGDERAHVAAAWALGDFTIIRYRADAKKLSPLLDADELKRFVVGLLGRAQAALTPTLLMRALEQRFDLGTVDVETIDDAAEAVAATGDVAAEVALRDAARAVVAELAPRQLEVLRRTIGDESVDAIGEALGCSVGTVVNERRRVGAVIARMSEDDEEREALLKFIADLLYGESEAR